MPLYQLNSSHRGERNNTKLSEEQKCTTKNGMKHCDGISCYLQLLKCHTTYCQFFW